MNNSVNNDHGFVGTGTPFFYPDNGSNPFFLGNPVSCKVSSGFEEKVRKSRRKGDAGSALDTMIIPKPAEVALTTDTFQPKTWAMAMMGKAGKVTATAQTVTDEQAIAVFDGYHELANHDIDESTFVVKKGGETLDKSTYQLNGSTGLFQITDESVAQVGDDLTVEYKTLQTTKVIIDAQKVTSFKGKLVIDGYNQVTKKPAKLIIPNVNLAVEGDIDWYSDDYNEIAMKGTASIGKNGEAPYTVELYEG